MAYSPETPDPYKIAFIQARMAEDKLLLSQLKSQGDTAGIQKVLRGYEQQYIDSKRNIETITARPKAEEEALLPVTERIAAKPDVYEAEPLSQEIEKIISWSDRAREIEGNGVTKKLMESAKGRIVVSDILPQIGKIEAAKMRLEAVNEEVNRRKVLREIAEGLDRNRDPGSPVAVLEHIDLLDKAEKGVNVESSPRAPEEMRKFNERGGSYGVVLRNIRKMLESMNTLQTVGIAKRIGEKQGVSEVFFPSIEDKNNQIRIAFRDRLPFDIKTREDLVRGMVESTSDIIMQIPTDEGKMSITISKADKSLRILDEGGEGRIDNSSSPGEQLSFMQRFQGVLAGAHERNPEEDVTEKKRTIVREAAKAVELVEGYSKIIESPEAKAFGEAFVYSEYITAKRRIEAKHAPQ